MGPYSSVIAWIGFGVVAGLAAMILPYNRGVRGIATNIALGIGGALLFGFVGRLLGLYHARDSFGFLFAAVGALTTLIVYHALWNRHHVRDTLPPAPPSRPDALR